MIMCLYVAPGRACRDRREGHVGDGQHRWQCDSRPWMPTVTIGITRGGNAHRLDEFIEVSPIRYGMKQLITLAIAAAEHYASDTDSSCFGSGSM